VDASADREVESQRAPDRLATANQPKSDPAIAMTTMTATRLGSSMLVRRSLRRCAPRFESA